VNIGFVQMEPKLLRNGWTDESTPPVPLLPANLAASNPDGFRRRGGGDGSSTSGNAEPPPPPRATSPTPVTIAGVTVRLPGWLPAWWDEFSSDKAVMVEVISRAVFPLMFLVFNAIYWPWYLM